MQFWSGAWTEFCRVKHYSQKNMSQIWTGIHLHKNNKKTSIHLSRVVD
jgi:hypothetical protein